MDRPNVDDVLKKYGSKIESNMRMSDYNASSSVWSAEYVKFKQEMAPDLTRFERWCRSLGSIIKINVSEKDRVRVKRQLEIAHLDIEPWQALTLSFMSFLFEKH